MIKGREPSPGELQIITPLKYAYVEAGDFQQVSSISFSFLTIRKSPKVYD